MSANRKSQAWSHTLSPTRTVRARTGALTARASPDKMLERVAKFRIFLLRTNVEHCSHRFGDCHDCSKPPDARRDGLHHHLACCPDLVASPQTMSSKRLDSIGDFSRHGYGLRVDCIRCGHFVVLNSHDVLQLCSARGWSKQTAAIEKRFRCSRCGACEIRIGPAFAP